MREDWYVVPARFALALNRQQNAEQAASASASDGAHMPAARQIHSLSIEDALLMALDPIDETSVPTKKLPRQAHGRVVK
jgi:hypothetical protein